MLDHLQIHLHDVRRDGISTEYSPLSHTMGCGYPDELVTMFGVTIGLVLESAAFLSFVTDCWSRENRFSRSTI